MDAQKLATLSQEITDLKALKDKSILINGEGHYITHNVTKAIQSLINVIELSGNVVNSSLTPTKISGVEFTDTINTQQHIQNYLVNYKDIAIENSEYLTKEVRFVLESSQFVLFRINQYLTSIIDAAYYN